MHKHIQQTFTIPDDYQGQRLDAALAACLPDYSRARLQTWIKSGEITVNNQQWKTRDKVKGGEQVEINAELIIETQAKPEPIDLAIIHEDQSLLVINKPAGIVVHPAAGHREGTLVNALLHHAPDLAHLPRAGIVHRIDKDTTGLLVIAKTLPVHHYLVNQLKEHAIEREYHAIVNGVMTGGGTIDAPIGRHPKHRKRMAIIDTGKPATTHYRVIQRFSAHTYIQVNLETGRTHQIRVHMAHKRYPLVGDPVYGGRPRLPKGASQCLCETLQSFKRQALHAKKLSLVHPQTNELVSWEAELPTDMQNLLLQLKNC